MGKSWSDLAAVLLMFSMAACQPTTTTVIRDVGGYQPRTWVGKSVPDIEAVWGPAKSGETDGSGGRIISYRGTSGVKVSMSAPDNLPDPGDDRDRQGKSEHDLLAEAQAPQANDEGRVDAKFWVDPSGKVYRYWFSEQVWKKTPEKTAPPAGPASGSSGQH